MAVLRRFDVSIIQVTIMSTINRQLCLKHRPEGLVRREDCDLVRQPLGELNDGEVLVRVPYISMDPTTRVWMRDVPQYMPPVALEK
jgi:NADPH-dependent curcumin reductase CurA